MLKRFPTVDDGPNPAGKPSPEKPSGEVGTSSHLYSLYFKGLVSEQQSSAGFGVAICGQKDDLLFQMKGPIFGHNITVMEAELSALKRGLAEAADLGINHITIYNDSYPIHELVTGRSVPKENNAAMLMNDVQRIRDRFSSSFPIFVAEESIKYAYKLARETIVSEISITMDMDPLRQTKPVKKVMTCLICLDDDINADQMFTVGKCRHRFCSECVRRHIEVRLLEGSVMRCPHHRCKFKLSLEKCVDLLTPEVRSMWQQRISEELIPFADRVYCPNPRCSALMSKPSGDGGGGVRNRISGFKCGEALCINCKVPWHSDLSCYDYKMLHPDATDNDGKLKSLANQRMWRQCRKCQHMLNFLEGVLG